MLSLSRYALTCLLAVLLAGCSRPSTPEPLQIGYLPVGGESGQRGLTLALREINDAEGLVLGRRMEALAPTVGTGKENLQAVATRLAAVNRVRGLLGGQDVAEADLIGRAAQPGSVCVVAACSAALEQLPENVFPVRLASADQGQLLARHAGEGLQVSRVLMLVSPEESSAELAKAFARHLLRGNPSGRAEFREVPAQGLETLLSDAAQAVSPQAVLFAGPRSGLVSLQEALRTSGLKVPLLVGTASTEPLALPAASAWDQPVWGISLYWPEGDNRYHQFSTTYTQEYGEPPPPAALLTYEGTKVMAAALRRSRLASREKLREELSKAFALRLDAEKPAEARSYPLPGR